MKKANFTRTPIASVCRVVLAVAMVFGAFALNAQTSYFDPGGASGNYTVPSSSTTTICPADLSGDPEGQVVSITFTGAYDLGTGTTLTVTEDVADLSNCAGTPAPVNVAGTSGQGIGSAPGAGAAITASAVSTTGCLTVSFDAPAGATIGAGYTFQASLAPRAGYVSPSGTQTLTIADCAAMVDLATLNITVPATDGICNMMVADDCAAVTGIGVTPTTGTSGTLTGMVPLGTTTITLTSPITGAVNTVVIRALPRPLACNDDVNVSLLNDCVVILTPDLLLEDPCGIPGVAYNVFFTNPNVNQMGTTVDGFPIVDFSGVDCGTRLDVKIERTIAGPCSTSPFVDACWEQIIIEDKLAPTVTGTDDYTIDCYFDTDGLIDDLPTDGNSKSISLSPSRVNSSELAGTSLAGVFPNPLVINSISSAFSIVDNCNASFGIGPWQEFVFDCSATSGNSGTDLYRELLTANGNIVSVNIRDFFDPQQPVGGAVFKMYIRAITAVDFCGNESTPVYQRIRVRQPEIVAPLPEIELGCGASYDPIDIYNTWAADPGKNFALAYTIPNFDQTPLTIAADFTNETVTIDLSVFTGGPSNPQTITLGSIIQNDIDFEIFNMVDTRDAAGTINGDRTVVPAYPEHAECGYAIDWDDSDEIRTCPQSFKVFREWTIYNWCDGHLELIDLIPQVIKVGDTQAPRLVDRNGTGRGTDDILFTLGTPDGTYDCAANVTVDVLADDDCSGVLQAQIQFFNLTGGPVAAQGPVVLEDGAGTFTVSNVPVGETINFTLTLVDECGNSRDYSGTRNITDVIPPVAICEQFRTVSMGLDCEVEVPAEAFDDGSYDNCGQVTFSVARMDEIGDNLFGEVNFTSGFFNGDEGVFGPSVRFTQADMDGCTGTQTVVFRVADGTGIDANADGDFNDSGDTYPNFNYCMVEVELQDKIPPVVRDRNITIDCDDTNADDFVQAALDGATAVQELLNSGSFVDPSGVAYISADSDNCDNTRLLIDAVDLNNFDATCRTGNIRLIYQAIDACGNVSLPAQSFVVFRQRSDWEMKFPYDAVVFCEDGVSIPAESTLNDILTNRGCDHWGLEVTEDQFDGVADACFKIIREYHLINWCTWEPSNTEKAIVERPDELITSDLPNDYRVALRYQDFWQNNGVSGGMAVNGNQQLISGADGINDIDDGNEDFDFNGDAANDRTNFTSPRYLYRNGFGFGRGGGAANPSAERLPMTGVSSGRTRSLDFMLGSNGDADEAAAYDPYDATVATIDGDWVLIDERDDPYDDGSNVAWDFVSQFSLGTETYVSAQHYGNIAYRQIIKVNDVTAPTVDITQDGEFCGGDEDPGDAACTGEVTLKFNIADLCSDRLETSYGLIAFRAPDYTGGTSIAGSALAGSFDFAEARDGDEIQLTGVFPLGRHSIEVTVIDNCLNKTVVEIDFEVIDCKAPTPKCLFGLSADLMPNGMLDIPAEWFDKGSYDFCDDDLDLYLDGPQGSYDLAAVQALVDAAAEGDEDAAAELASLETRTFECAEGDIGMVVVKLFAVDDAGNVAYCETFVNLTRNATTTSGAGEGCPVSGASISGAISTEGADAVENVEVNLSGNTDATIVTSAAGQYSFVSLDAGYDYSVTPASDDQPLNGVSTFDLVLISKHILGTELLDSPYKLIAADVNNSGSITTFDMVTLRKVILNIETNFPNNTSWRFVPADYEFTNVANPFAENFPEVSNMNDIEESAYSVNFVAIKVGDVNASAVPNSDIAEGRSFAGTFALTANDARLTIGEEYTVSFTAEEVAGYQFTMNFDGVELVKVEEGLATAENFGIFENELTASWNGVASDEVAFSVVVKATEDTRLSEAIAITSSKTAAEAYDVNGTVKAVAVNFVDAGYELAQNRPNPFSGETLIQITLPEAQRASLTVSDVTGKVLKVITQNFEAGYNEVKLNSKELASGVLYYTLRTDNFTATRKMVIME